MRNREKWMPTKYIVKNGALRGARNPAELSTGSILIADINATFFDRSIQKYAKGRLIDLGCGKVPLYHAYKNFVTENICVDWRNSVHENEFLDFECDLNSRLPFEDAEFETVILSDVLEHIREPGILWEEMSRILKKSGHALISVPFFYWIHEAPFDYFRYTKYALYHFIEKNGFEIVEFETTGGALEIMTDMTAKHLQFFPVIGKPLSRFIQYFVLLFRKTRIGGFFSKRSMNVFPLGYFLVLRKP
jgi:SAM-dependent methyltransferase